MLSFCITILVYPQNLVFFLSKQKANNGLKYKQLKACSCPFSGHLRPLLGNVSELLRVDSVLNEDKKFCPCLFILTPTLGAPLRAYFSLYRTI
jgi:hypothetical protein